MFEDLRDGIAYIGGWKVVIGLLLFYTIIAYGVIHFVMKYW